MHVVRKRRNEIVKIELPDRIDNLNENLKFQDRGKMKMKMKIRNILYVKKITMQ